MRALHFASLNAPILSCYIFQKDSSLEYTNPTNPATLKAAAPGKCLAACPSPPTFVIRKQDQENLCISAVLFNQLDFALHLNRIRRTAVWPLASVAKGNELARTEQTSSHRLVRDSRSESFQQRLDNITRTASVPKSKNIPSLLL